MPQIVAGEVFVDSVDPGDIVNATRLNAHVNDATLANGSVIDQNDVNSRVGNTLTLAADTVLLGDSTAADTGVPLKVPISRLLIEAQRNGTQQFASGNSSGGGAAYVLTCSPATTAYNGGEVVRFKADAANTGAVTVNVDTIGVKSIVDRSGAALQANAILSGQTCEIVYDSGNAYFVLMSAVPLNSVTAGDLTEATRDQTYSHESAGTTHASAGGFDTYTVTLSPAPTGLLTGMKFRFKVTAAASNTQPAKVVVNYVSGSSGAIGLVKGGVSAALPLVANDLVAGAFAEVVYDGTNFQLMNPRCFDFISALTHAPAASAVATFAHGLGVVPGKVRVTLVQTNSSAENGYNQNDELDIFCNSDANGRCAFGVVADATNITVIRTNGVNVFQFPKGGGAVVDQATNVNTPNFYWQLKVYASI